MSRAKLHVAEPPLALEFGKRGELRQAVGDSGRVHLDRWLPFITVHRASDQSASIARKVAVNSPAYLVWSPGDDAAAGRTFAAIAAALHERFGGILVLEVADAAWAPVAKGSQHLHPFDFRIAASGGSGARRALDCLADALGKIRIDLRKPTVDPGTAEEPPLLHAAGVPFDRLSIVIPQIHREDEATVYPQLTRDLAAAVGDALLQAACAFASHRGTGAPAHYRSLGRSA